MAEELPKQAPNKTNDNLNQINADVDALYAQYIKPIEAMRSKARPLLQAPDNYAEETKKILNSQKNTDARFPLESRAHAFYRMIGFPVVSPENGYYSPGFNPIKDAKDQQAKINSAYYQKKNLANFVYEREKNVVGFEEFFRTTTDELETMVYCLVSRDTFPFSVFSAGLTDHLELDPQSITLDNRSLPLFEANNEIKSELSIEEIVAIYKKVLHPIKPFIVDPRMTEIVTPQENIICAPFLKNKEQTAIEKDVFLKTPVIQDIIEQRLEDSEVNEGFLKSLENLFKGNTDNKATTDSELEILVNTVAGFLSDPKVTEEAKDIATEKISGVSNVQYQEATKITKTIKSLIKKLIESQKVLDNINAIISWTPVPGSSGPGYLEGFKLSEAYNGVQLKVVYKIRDLKLKKKVAELEVAKKTEAGVSASPFVRNNHSESLKQYDTELNKLTSETNELAKKGFKALRNIEIIKGEVSGLGLVDVLAIYYGLWSMSIENLLYLIDDNAIKRMVDYNPKYKSLPVVESRQQTAGTSGEVLKALRELELKVFFILNLADFFYDQSLNIKESKDSG